MKDKSLIKSLIIFFLIILNSIFLYLKKEYNLNERLVRIVHFSFFILFAVTTTILFVEIIKKKNK